MGFDGPGLASQRIKEIQVFCYSKRPRLAIVPTTHPIQWVPPDFFPWGKEAGS